MKTVHKDYGPVSMKHIPCPTIANVCFLCCFSSASSCCGGHVLDRCRFSEVEASWTCCSANGIGSACWRRRAARGCLINLSASCTEHPLSLEKALSAEVSPISVCQLWIVAKVLCLAEGVLPRPGVAALGGQHSPPVSLCATASADPLCMWALFPEGLVRRHRRTLALSLASNLSLPIRGIDGASSGPLRRCTGSGWASNLPLQIRGIGGAACGSGCRGIRTQGDGLAGLTVGGLLRLSIGLPSAQGEAAQRL